MIYEKIEINIFENQGTGRGANIGKITLDACTDGQGLDSLLDSLTQNIYRHQCVEFEIKIQGGDL